MSKYGASFFSEELALIANEKIRKFTTSALNVLPDYFFEIPASSSGKYHPAYALGQGGLVRHTKAAARIAHELFRCDTICGHYTRDQKDMIISALLLHDGCKSGITKQDYTVSNHPVLLVQHVHEKMCVLFPGEFDDVMPQILKLVSTHMGQWNTEGSKSSPNYGNPVCPLPETGAQKFVHMCDYLASRKLFEVNFSAPLS